MNVDASCGTLVWIGDPSIAEFKDAYRYCVSQVAQLAVRRSLDEALWRPAAAVRCILIARQSRQPIKGRLLDQLRQLYPEATILHLLGSLCQGMRSGGELWSSSQAVPWHRWNQVLPNWLTACGPPPEQHCPACRSVAVVTSTFWAAEPLLDLAQSAGVTAVWCRSASSMQVRNIDAVWWDDSVAGPTHAAAWRRRTATFALGDRTCKHAWIVNSPRNDQCREAMHGGIDVVVSKPYRIGCLLETLQGADAGQTSRSLVALQAA